MAAIRSFGMAGEVAVEAVRIAAGALSADILTYGAVLRGLWHADVEHSLVLGLNSAEDYVAHSPYFGAVVGRVANRIANGCFTLDGRDYHLDRNECGRTTLHGGTRGFSHRVWTLDVAQEDCVLLSLTSPDGEDGFPGMLRAHCEWRIAGEATLQLTLEAVCEAPTPVNLTAHPYFTLDGAPRIDAHEIAIAADHYTPVDADLIPTGVIARCDGTQYDFRTSRRIGTDPFDVNLCLTHGASVDVRPAAWVQAGGLALEVACTAPGLQFYTGDHVAVPVRGIDRHSYGARSGLCLEPQAFPDAPNQLHFPDITLRPGERYRSTIAYTLRSL